MNKNTIDLIELFQQELGVTNPSDTAVNAARSLIIEFIKDEKILLQAFVVAHGGKPRRRHKSKKTTTTNTTGEIK
jgi:hypothetical protein